MDLIELRQVIRRWWPVGLITFLAVAILGTTWLGPAEGRFASSSTLLVTPRPERFETVSTGVLRIVLPNVLVVARSRDLHAAAGDALGEVADEDAEIDASFVADTGVLTVVARSTSYRAAIGWSVAVAEELVERYSADDYLIVELLDRATRAAEPGPMDAAVDLVGIALLSTFASILVMFGVQRARESGDVAGRVRAGGLRVLAELVIPTRSARPSFSKDAQGGRLALSIAAAPDVEEGDTFVVSSDDTRPSLAVVDALRAGLHQARLHRRHKVVLGPSLDDLAQLRAETSPAGRCVAVLDSLQRIDRFVDDVNALVDAGIPIVGVVIVHRRLFRRSAIRTEPMPGERTGRRGRREKADSVGGRT